jgi:hypothetical protein
LRLFDPDAMSSRLVQVLLGAVWTVGGVLMAFNPPPQRLRRSALLPVIGWVVLAGGLYIAAKVLLAADVNGSGRPPRHADGSRRCVVGNQLWTALGAGVGYRGSGHVGAGIRRITAASPRTLAHERTVALDYETVGYEPVCTPASPALTSRTLSTTQNAQLTLANGRTRPR